MFVALSMSVSVAILFLLYFYSKQRTQSQQRCYQQIVSLRLIMELCRKHRALTHQAILKQNLDDVAPINEVEQLMLNQSNNLIGLASSESKSLFRILQMKTSQLGNNWQQRSFARNQRLHGTAIRHCMFLLDEIVLAWMLESGRDDLTDEYHLNWQQVLDSMEVLTQMRICIHEAEQTNEPLRVIYHADKVLHKLQHLSLISPLTIQSPLGQKTKTALATLISQPSFHFEAEPLYCLTSDISQLIAQVYDDMLSEITQSLYQPLPDLATPMGVNQLNLDPISKAN